MIFSNDTEWDSWECSFDSNFWMTQEQRDELAKKQKLAIEARSNVEQEAVDVLFRLFGSVDRTTPPVLDESEIQLAPDIEEAVVNECINNYDTFDLGKSNDGFLSESTTHEPRSTIHEIPKEQHIVPNKECDASEIPPTTKCNVIPVDTDKRDRREEERADKLKENKSYTNTIMKYATKKHKNGIEGTEITKKRKSRSKISKPGKKLKTGGKKVQNKEKSSTTTKKTTDTKKTFTSSKENNKVCLIFAQKTFFGI